jgi:hypothetical protein
MSVPHTNVSLTTAPVVVSHRLEPLQVNVSSQEFDGSEAVQVPAVPKALGLQSLS